MPPVGTSVRLEIRPRKLWRPAEQGLDDDRELGVAVGRWRFVKEPGPDAGAG